MTAAQAIRDAIDRHVINHIVEPKAVVVPWEVKSAFLMEHHPNAVGEDVYAYGVLLLSEHEVAP